MMPLWPLPLLGGLLLASSSPTFAGSSYQQGANSQSGPGMTTIERDVYIVEAVCAMLILVIVINLLLGLRYNSRVVSAWARTFASPGGLFDKSFTNIGPPSAHAKPPCSKPEDVMINESASVSKFYASGRRHCQGVLATLVLCARHDPVSRIKSLVDSEEDQAHVDVYMSEGSVPPMTLAVATNKQAKALQRDRRDIQRYTKSIKISKDQMPSWPHEKMQVLGEHSSIFYDIFSDTKLANIFNTSSPHGPSVAKYFRSLHISSDFAGSSHKQMIKFIFALPPPNKMEDLTRLMEMVPQCIDTVGAFRLTPELKKKALDARAEVERNDEEERRKRIEALQKKKEDKLLEEKLRVARMTPEERANYDAKQNKAKYKVQYKKK